MQLIDYEIIIIVGFIFIQIIHSVKVLVRIVELQNIFADKIIVKPGWIEKSKLQNKDGLMKHISFKKDNEEEVGEGYTSIAVTFTDGESEVIEKIRDAINKYLVSNYGAPVNFSIIKDIIDREVDAADEEISQAIPTPLYLGLAATMVGIIFGLFSFSESAAQQYDIAPLVNGVKVAMSASLTGLALTTILSSFFYKRAKKIVLRGKNDQLNYLLEKLLPELIKSEDTGVTGLKSSLDHFSREATVIVDNVKSAAVQTGENLRFQQGTLDKVEKLNISRLSKANVEMFDRLDTNMGAFIKFSEYLSEMKEISFNLRKFAERTADIDKISGAIHSTLIRSDELGRFLTEHFKKIEDAGTAALHTVNISDAHFREAIDKLREEVDKRISSLNMSANNHHSQLQEIYNKIGEGLNEIALGHMKELQKVYSDSIPHFEQLDRLELLSPINETLATKTDQLVTNSQTSSESIIEILRDLKNNMSQISYQNNSLEKLNTSIGQLVQQMAAVRQKPSEKKGLKVAESLVKIAAGIMVIAAGGYFIYTYYFEV